MYDNSTYILVTVLTVYKLINQAVREWCKDDPGLQHGLVLEQQGDILRLRVKAGPLWEGGAAGPTLIAYKLPKARIVS